jgi:hypothetical protein
MDNNTYQQSSRTQWPTTRGNTRSQTSSVSSLGESTLSPGPEAAEAAVDDVVRVKG